MSETPHLLLPLLAAAQAQKHVTHNEALAALDALVHLAVKERDRATPPGFPAEGDRYHVGAAASGAFAGHAGAIAFFDLGLWRFLAPRPGWRAYVEAEDRIIVHDGAVWHDLGHYNRDLDNIDMLGVGTAADAVNRFAAKLNAALFTARTVAEGGTGDLRVTLNKEATADILSLLYQRGFGGRAETGLIGDDDYRIKVSPDGAAWHDALRIDRATGDVALPATAGGLRNLLINPNFAVNQRVFAGGSLPSGAYGFDRWKAGAGGCLLTRATDGTMTLTGTLVQVIEAPGLAGQTVTVSVENPTSTLSVDVAGAAGTITAGSGRRALTLTLPSAATGHVAVMLSGTAASFIRPMASRGAMPHGYERLPFGLTLALCQRYYEKSYDLAAVPGGVSTAGSRLTRASLAGQSILDGFATVFAVRKRATPTITWYSTSTLAGRVRDITAGSDVVIASTSGTGEGHTGAPVSAGAVAVGNTHQAHWTADAEL